MRYKKYTGIVLKHQPLREADEVLTFWSWEEGKVRLLVRGVRRSTSRLKGAVSPLGWLELRVAASEYLPVVAGARLVRGYGAISSRLAHVALVFTLFEMVMRSTADKQSNQSLSLLLRESLQYLTTRSEAGIEFLVTARLGLLASLGYRLAFDACASCGKPLYLTGDSAGFSNQLSGLICDRCRSMVADSVAVSAEVVGYLRETGKQSGPFAVLPATAEVARDADQLVADFFQYVIERKVNSERFLVQTIPR